MREMNRIGGYEEMNTGETIQIDSRLMLFTAKSLQSHSFISVKKGKPDTLSCIGGYGW